MRALVRPAVSVWVLMVWVLIMSVAAVSAESPLTKQDRQGPVTVAVTLMAPPITGTALKPKVVLDTHSAALDGIAFEEAVALRKPDGTDIVPVAVEQAEGSGHHREAVLVFPPVTEGARIQIVVKNVGGVKERIFAWEPPAGR